MGKVFVTADQLLAYSYELALNVFDSGYRPSSIIAVWRGGASIGIAVQELLEYCGVKTNCIVVRTSSYPAIGQRQKEVQVHGLSDAADKFCPDDRVLIVDDVHDSGLSVAELLRQLQQKCGQRLPRNIRLATVYYKPQQSKVARVPDYYIQETSEWLVFPHELAGLTTQEIAESKPGLQRVRERLIHYANDCS